MSRLSNINYVRQEDPYGCQYACLAMLIGKKYSDIRGELGPLGKHGCSYDLWKEVLSRNGFAYQFHWRFDQQTNKIRSIWPLPLWADAHICTVDAGQGDGSHAVIVLRDGTVLDPHSGPGKQFKDYSGTTYMAGIYDVGNAPTIPSPNRNTEKSE